MKKCGLIFFIAALFVSTFAVASAQTDSLNNAAIINDPLTISISPRNPQPGQAFTTEVTAQSLPLDSASIVWKINSAAYSQGTGLRKISTTAPKVGGNLVIDVGVFFQDGRSFTKSLSVSSATIDLIWEGKSYVPPFYKGKPQLPYQGSLVVQALPITSSDGTVLNPKDLVYTWKQENTPIQNGSGYGKDSIVLSQTGVVIRPLIISVTATTKDNKTIGSGNIVITPINPKVVLYENNQLYGVLYNTSLSSTQTITMRNKEMVINAVPYFFSTTSNLPFFGTFNWSVNNTAVASEKNGTNNLLIVKPDNAKGTSIVSVKVTTPQKLLQYNNSGVSISF